MTREWLTLAIGAWAVLLIGFATQQPWLLAAALLLQFVAAAFYTPRRTA